MFLFFLIKLHYQVDLLHRAYKINIRVVSRRWKSHMWYTCIILYEHIYDIETEFQITFSEFLLFFFLCTIDYYTIYSSMFNCCGSYAIFFLVRKLDYVKQRRLFEIIKNGYEVQVYVQWEETFLECKGEYSWRSATLIILYYWPVAKLRGKRVHGFWTKSFWVANSNALIHFQLKLFVHV